MAAEGDARVCENRTLGWQEPYSSCEYAILAAVFSVRVAYLICFGANLQIFIIYLL